MRETEHSTSGYRRRGVLCATASFALGGCAGLSGEQTTPAQRSATPTAAQRGADDDETESPSATDATTSASERADQPAYPVDHPRRQESFPNDIGPLVRSRETQITQPIRSQAEWDRLLSRPGEKTQTAFANYDFVTQTNFSSELVVFLQSRGPIGSLIRLLWAEREADEIRFLTERHRVSQADMPVMQYLFFRMEKMNEQLERIEGRLKTGDRRFEILYHPPPCACRYSKTES